MYNISKTQFLKTYKGECAPKDALYNLYKYLIDKNKDFNIKGKYYYNHNNSYKSFEATFVTTEFDKSKMKDVPYNCLVHTLHTNTLLNLSNIITLLK